MRCPLILLIALVNGCHGPQSSSVRSAVTGLEGVASLGMGYDTYLKKFTGSKCVKINPSRIEPIEHSEPKAIEKVTGVKTTSILQGGAAYYQDMNFGQIHDLLKGSITVEIPINPMIVLAGSAEFANESASSEFKQNFVFSYHLVKNIDQFAAEALTVDSEFLKQIKGTSDRDEVRKAPSVEVPCGQEYVAQIDYGAEYVAIMSVEYRNQFERQKFGGSIAAKIGVLGMSFEIGKAALHHLTQEVRESTKISVRVLQRGGDPNHLMNAIPLADADETPQAGIGMIHCTLANFQPCVDAMSRLVIYGLEDFPSQLGSQESLYPISYTTRPYPFKELEPIKPLTKEEKQRVHAKVRQIQSLLDQTYTDYRRARSLLADAYKVESNVPTHVAIDEGRMIQISDTLESNILIYTEALRYCEEFPGLECIAVIESEYLPLAKDYDRTPLSTKPARFEQWCAMYEGDNKIYEEKLSLPTILTHSEYETMHSIILRAANAAGGTECAKAVPYLSNVSEFSLRGGIFSNLTPLASLPNIRSLDLSENRGIEDLSQIKNFYALWSLNVSYTGVRQLSTFINSGWEDLSVIDLRGNQISDPENIQHEFWGNRKLLVDPLGN